MWREEDGLKGRWEVKVVRDGEKGGPRFGL